MKTLQIFTCFITLFLPHLLLAQDITGNHELSASYGVFSGTDMIRGFITSNHRPNPDFSSYNRATSASGNMFLTYRYIVSNKMELGAAFGSEFVSFDHYSNPLGRPPVLMGKYKASVTTLAFEVKPVYSNWNLVQLYGFLGLGARYYTEKQVWGQQIAHIGININDFPTFFINSQWTPIGIRVGKTLSGFAEFGLGYKGLINGGIAYRLCHAKPNKETGKK